MATFDVVVIESVATEKLYTVEADSIEDAKAAAEMGNTIRETTIKDRGVVNRVVCEVVNA